MSANTAAIQKLYVAYFNRPADFSGLGFWEGAFVGAKDPKAVLATISAQFATSAEYKATFAGLDEAHIVNQVYLNLFGRPADDLVGLNFWTQALLHKDMTVDNVVTKIAEGAQNADKTALNNKIAAAVAFTAALDTSAKALGYSGEQANGIAKQWLSTIGDDASLTLGTDKAALDALISDVVEHGPQPVGQSFTLTQGLDTFPGTTGNDTFNVYSFNPTTGVVADNLNTFDAIDGSAGKDTLNIEIKGGHNTLATSLGSVKNVEIINITADVAQAVNAAKFAGATSINQIGTAGAVTNLGEKTTAGFNSTATDMDVTAAGASAAVSFTNVDEGAKLFIDGDNLTSVTASGTRVDGTDVGTSVSALELHAMAGVDVKTMTVNTGAKTTLFIDENGASAKHVTTVDASASTGGITFVAGVNVLNVKTGSAVDTVTVAATTVAATTSAAAINSLVSTGAGNDIITVTNVGNGLTTIDAGAGNDKVTVTKAVGAALSVQGGDGNDIITLKGAALETTDVITGGAGNDTVSVTAAAARLADDYIVFNKLLTGFETITFTGAAEAALDASQLAANYTTLDLSTGSAVSKVGAQALIANGDLAATASGYATPASGTTYAGTLNVTEKVSGGLVTAKAEAVNLTVKAGAADMAALLKGDVHSAVISLTNSVDDADSPTVDTIASVTVSSTDFAALKSVTLTGNGSAIVHNTGGSLVTVDASGLGGTLVVGTGATAGLSYDSTNAKVETIKLGSGIDHLVVGASTYGAMDTVSGLSLSLKADGTLKASSDTLLVTNATAAVKFTTTQTDIDFALKDAAAAQTGKTVVFQLGGDTYVYHDGGTAGAVDAADVLVKVVGTIDLDALVKSLG